MDLQDEVINLEDSDVEFIGEEETPSASIANKTNQKNNKKQQNQPVEAMETDDILPKNNQT